MNINQQNFSQIFGNNLQQNLSQTGINAASLTVGSTFDALSALSKGAGASRFFTTTQDIFGATANGVIGGSDLSSFAGSVAGVGVGLIVGLAAVPTLSLSATIGVFVAAGIAGSVASILVDTLVDSYLEYQAQNPSAPDASQLFGNDILSHTFGDSLGDAVDLGVIILDADDALVSLDNAANNLVSTVQSFNDTLGASVITVEDILTANTASDIVELITFEQNGVSFQLFGEFVQVLLMGLADSLLQYKQALIQNSGELNEQDPELAQQIAAINTSVTALINTVAFHTPLILDLDGDGIETISFSENEGTFDFGAGDGEIAHGWVGADDGLLVFDGNGNGTIDDASELFGSTTVDGFSELELFDSNQDGIVNLDDDRFDELLVWQDSNSDNISQQDELRSLSDVGITDISLNVSLTNQFNSMNWVPLVSEYTTLSGETFAIADVFFARFFSDEDASSASENALDHHANTRVLIGTTGDDTIASNEIDQVLMGGAGIDTFVFAADDSHNLISDFEEDHDFIDVRDWNISGLEELGFSVDGGDLIIRYAENEIHVSGVTEVSEDHFIF